MGQHDYNFDGRADAFDFVADVAAPFTIHGVKALLQFQYTYEVCARL